MKQPWKFTYILGVEPEEKIIIPNNNSISCLIYGLSTPTPPSRVMKREDAGRLSSLTGFAPSFALNSGIELCMKSTCGGTKGILCSTASSYIAIILWLIYYSFLGWRHRRIWLGGNPNDDDDDGYDYGCSAAKNSSSDYMGGNLFEPDYEVGLFRSGVVCTIMLWLFNQSCSRFSRRSFSQGKVRSIQEGRHLPREEGYNEGNKFDSFVYFVNSILGECLT